MATLFDTGFASTAIRLGSDVDSAPSTEILGCDPTTASGSGCALNPGTTFTGKFAGAPGYPNLTWSFVAGSNGSVNAVNYNTTGTGAPAQNVNTGLNLFNDFDVLFSVSDKRIYLRPNGGQAAVILTSSVTTTGAQSYEQGNASLSGTYTTQGGAVAVAGTTTLAGDTQITTGGGAVTFSGTVDSATDEAALTVNTIGATNFVRAVGWVNPLLSLTTTGGGPTATSSVSTTGSQTYSGDVSLNGTYWVYDEGSAFTVAGATTLAGPASVNGCGGAGTPEQACTDTGVSIVFDGVVDSLANKGFTLAVAAGDDGIVEFKGAVGGTNALGGLAIYSANTVTASGRVSLDGGLGYSSGEGLQIGSTYRNLRVGTAHFARGGSIVGFQTNGGTPNGACSDKRPGACGSGVVVNGTPGGSIKGFTISNNASYGIYVTNPPLNLTNTDNHFIGNAGPDIGPLIGS